jgi:hypothetical protein
MCTVDHDLVFRAISVEQRLKLMGQAMLAFEAIIWSSWTRYRSQRTHKL